MELKKVADEIESRIKLLGVARKDLRNRAENKALKTGQYEKKLAQVIMQLRNGVALELNGQKIKDPPTTIIEKVARGICWEEKIETDLAESEYRLALVGISSLETEIQGYQSIFKYMDET